jgi:hypothetical protein
MTALPPTTAMPARASSATPVGKLPLPDPNGTTAAALFLVSWRLSPLLPGATAAAAGSSSCGSSTGTVRPSAVPSKR